MPTLESHLTLTRYDVSKVCLKGLVMNIRRDDIKMEKQVELFYIPQTCIKPFYLSIVDLICSFSCQIVFKIGVSRYLNF